MGNLERLTGSPWHVEKMTRQEGDEKRHKSRCTNSGLKEYRMQEVILRR